MASALQESLPNEVWGGVHRDGVVLQLKQSFFLRPTPDVAVELLGKRLVRRVGERELVGRIVETEAYWGPKDLASHASRGRTARTEVMFGIGGYWYVYLIYGMYYCLNVVTEGEGFPAAVLIRAVEPLSGLEPEAKTNGPGKLCRAFQIDKTLNRAVAFAKDSLLWIEDAGETVAPRDIARGPRVGVDYAGAYKEKPWRFYLKGNAFVSRK